MKMSILPLCLFSVLYASESTSLLALTKTIATKLPIISTAKSTFYYNGTFSNNNQLYAACGNSMTGVWDTSSGAQTQLWDAGHIPASLVFDKDITRPSLASVSGEDGVIKIWNPTEGEVIQTIELPHTVIRDLAYDPNNRLLACCVSESELSLIDTQNCTTLRRFPYNKAQESRIKINPACTLIAAWNQISSPEKDPMNISLFNICDGTSVTIQNPYPQAGLLRSLTFTPDSRMLMSGFNNLIKLHDTKTGEWLQTFAIVEDGSVVTERDNQPPHTINKCIAQFTGKEKTFLLHITDSNTLDITELDIQGSIGIRRVMPFDFSNDGTMLALATLRPEEENHIEMWKISHADQE